MPSALTVFVDTNVLLYAQDPRNAVKQQAAEQWLRYCWQAQVGRISTQVLNELYANLRRVAPNLLVEQARSVVKQYRGWKPWVVDDVTVDLAWTLQDRYSLSYWDALMVAAAQHSGCRYLLSEDMNHEQHYDAVQVINPFKTSVDLLGKL